ncbi:MAG: helix-turn-helix transcriptional regulator [Polyangiaceae bacterium]|nr:helix-turn-helix transcriptional regulator [Polyangiaceae bacterium]
MPNDIIDIVEAAYDVERTESSWLENLVRAATPSLDHGLGVVGYVYDASDLDEVKVGSFHSDLRAPVLSSREQVQALIRHSDPTYVQRTWRGLPCSTISETPDIEEQPGYTAMRALGLHDALVINGIDPTWHGCWLGAFLPEVTKLAPEVAARWARIAAHIASGFRVRRKLEQLEQLEQLNATNGAEAILSPGGKVIHAEEAAASKAARDSLREAAIAIDRARTKGRRARADSVDEWKGLVAARWTIVDHFENDGRRYLCARRNDALPEKDTGLTDREFQVTAFLSLGHTTKLIAYELGISASTVRVLVGRASAKLGANTRAELVTAFQRGAFTLARKS